MQLKKQLTNVTPMKLLAIHAPDDEYDLESKKIASLINENNNIDEIAVVISMIFTHSFNEHFSKEMFIKTAREIKLDLNAIE